MCSALGSQLSVPRLVLCMGKPAPCNQRHVHCAPSAWESLHRVTKTCALHCKDCSLYQDMCSALEGLVRVPRHVLNLHGKTCSVSQRRVLCMGVCSVQPRHVFCMGKPAPCKQDMCSARESAPCKQDVCYAWESLLHVTKTCALHGSLLRVSKTCAMHGKVCSM